MLARLLSIAVVVACLLGGGAVALEAMGLLRSNPAVSGQPRIEATIAHIDATVDPRDLPSEAEAQGLWPPAERHAKSETGDADDRDEAVVASLPNDPKDAGAPKVPPVGEALAVSFTAKSGVGEEPKALDPDPPQTLSVAAPKLMTGTLARPASEAKACAGACKAKTPVAKTPVTGRARPHRTADVLSCTAWAPEPAGGAKLGWSSCSVALLP